VLWAQDSFTSGGKEYPAGTAIVGSSGTSQSFIESLAKELHIDIAGTSAQPSVKTYKLKTPRIALYKSYVPSMDEGWTRWMFEHYEFPFKNIYDAEVRAGDLAGRYDVIVIPSSGTEALVNGNKPGTIPPQYVGGLTEQGVKNIRAFVEQGGTLVTLRDACLFAIDKLEIPAFDALKGLRPQGRGEGSGTAQAAKFACPGSMLRMNFNAKHPVAYGMPDEAPGMFYGGTAFDLPAADKDKPGPVAVVKYPGKDLLLSGFLQGEKYLWNKAAVADVPLGKGKIVLLGFAVQNRAQPHATFKLLFNSLYYGAVQRPVEP